MANPAQEHEALLRRHRFVLVSENKHRKYRDPEGRVYIVSKTPSDWWAWRNAVSTLKRVTVSAVPSSELLEAERQRRELEASIVLQAQRKPSVAGISGAGKGKKFRGTGFIYEDKAAVELTPEQLEQRQRARERSERRKDERRAARLANRESYEWKNRLYEFRRSMRDAKSDLEMAFRVAKAYVAMRAARDAFARTIVGVEKRETRKSLVRQNETGYVVGGLAMDILNSLNTPNASEQLYMVCVTDDMSFLPAPPPLDELRDTRLFKASEIVNASFRALISQEQRKEMIDMASAIAIAIWWASDRAPAWAFQLPGDTPLEIHAQQRRRLREAARGVEHECSKRWQWVSQAIVRLLDEVCAASVAEIPAMTEGMQKPSIEMRAQ
jgi:hypothetical protein